MPASSLLESVEASSFLLFIKYHSKALVGQTVKSLAHSETSNCAKRARYTENTSKGQRRYKEAARQNSGSCLALSSKPRLNTLAQMPMIWNFIIMLDMFCICNHVHHQNKMICKQDKTVHASVTQSWRLPAAVCPKHWWLQNLSHVPEGWPSRRCWSSQPDQWFKCWFWSARSAKKILYFKKLERSNTDNDSLSMPPCAYSQSPLVPFSVLELQLKPWTGKPKNIF